MLNLPTPKSAVGKLVLRLVIVAVVAVLGYLVSNPDLVGGGIVYLVVKTLYDLLNANTPNLRG